MTPNGQILLSFTHSFKSGVVSLASVDFIQIYPGKEREPDLTPSGLEKGKPTIFFHQSIQKQSDEKSTVFVASDGEEQRCALSLHQERD